MTIQQETSKRAPKRKRRRWPFVLVGAVVAVAVLAVGGTAFYINVIHDDAPAAFAIDDNEQAAAAAPTGAVAGNWAVVTGSQAGYRVDEVLAGQNVEAAGRTSEVTGSMTVEGTQVTAATFEVDMASVATDSDNRDNSYRTRIMDTDTYPTSTFVLTEPIELAPVPEDATPRTYTAVGDLTLRGVTKPVTIDLQAQRTGEQIRLVGQIGVVFAEFEIPNPSIAGFVTTEDNGIMEVDLRLEKS